ncbi:SEC14 domain and spectrin repeat-containing protein 1-B isoform X2 [Drosophila takahashii]|uniref:SEC14 domain and spectrin repeat-containing protein 1-B isoform X2 n=1 Tax=Drosophila takahashii TaxID=29030 RepID=UPI0038991097
MEEDVLNALQTRSVYLSGGFDRQKRIIFVVNAFNDLQLWNRRYLQVTLDYLKRSLSASVLQNGVSVVVNAQESSSRISRQQVRQIYALFGGDINVDLYLVRAEGFWEKHVEPCTKSQVKGEPLVLSKARLFKFIEPQNLPEELGGTLQFNYDLWLQQRKSIDEFTKSHVQTLGSMERLLALLREHKSLRPAEADVELKKCAQLHAGVQNDIETAIDMGNAILARFNEVYETHSPPPQAVAPASESPVNAHPPPMPAHSATGIPPQQQLKPLLPPDLVCERARIELRLNEIEKKQTAIRTAWLELLRSLREARELGTLEEGVSFVTNWILQQAEQLLSRQRSIAGDVRGCEALRSAHDQLELECRETYGCYAELLYKIERFAGERQASPKDKDLCQDLLSQRDFMQFVCRSFAKRLERRRNVLMTALRFHRLLEQFEELLTTGNHVVEVDSRSLDWPEAEQLLMQLKENQEMLGHVERELVREGEKLSDMLAMPVKDALGRDLQLDYSPEIAQLRRQIDESRRRRQVCWSRLALQRLTLEQVTHIHAYEEDARRARDWLQELYAVLLRCHSHVGCNIHEIQLQKDELQGFEETGRSIYHYGCQLLEASQTLRLCCKLDPAASRSQSNLGQSLISDELQLTWHSLQAVAQEQMTRLRVSAVFHRSVEAYYRQLRELRPLLTQELSAQLQQQQRQQHNRSSSGISSDAEGEIESELSPLGEMPPRLQRHLVAREQLLVEVGRMVRLGRLLKKRLKEPFVLDALTGKSCVSALDFNPTNRRLLHYAQRIELGEKITAKRSAYQLKHEKDFHSNPTSSRQIN